MLLLRPWSACSCASVLDGVLPLAGSGLWAPGKTVCRTGSLLTPPLEGLQERRIRSCLNDLQRIVTSGDDACMHSLCRT